MRPPLLLLALLGGATLHCGGATDAAAIADGGPGPLDGGSSDPLPPAKNADAVGASTSSKVDVLLVVDNSARMGDMQHAFAASLPAFLASVATSGDVHVGVIDSSLGTMGGDVCPSSVLALNGLAHLRTTGAAGVAVANASRGFISFGAGGDVSSLSADVTALVNGVGEDGCGLEAQLESAYRFLVQPDPWAKVELDDARVATFVGVDDALLAQRKAFLRPDSLVVVIMLTDEDDSSPDPRSVGGQGWAFAAQAFPGSSNVRVDGKSTTAPHATSICATDPGSADCTSCGFVASCNKADPACAKIVNDPQCQRDGGYYAATEDPLNVRFFHMKQRFGIDPQYPLARYVDGLTKQRVPDRDGEHTLADRSYGSYTGDARCTNPLFAASLPGASTDELCHLPAGPRGKELVLFAVIGGMPPLDAGAAPDWTKLLGKDPATYAFDGIDPHMIQSTTPRIGLPEPSLTRGDNGPDPVSGREWDTGGEDLEYACTFALPAARSCSSASYSCECADTSNPPICGAPAGQQLRGKAYPSIRELRVVKELGDRGVAGSICPQDATLGYVDTMKTLAQRATARLTR